MAYVSFTGEIVSAKGRLRNHRASFWLCRRAPILLDRISCMVNHNSGPVPWRTSIGQVVKSGVDCERWVDVRVQPCISFGSSVNIDCDCREKKNGDLRRPNRPFLHAPHLTGGKSLDDVKVFFVRRKHYPSAPDEDAANLFATGVFRRWQA